MLAKKNYSALISLGVGQKGSPYGLHLYMSATAVGSVQDLIFFYNQNACTNMYVQTSVLVTLIRTDTTSNILENTHATKGG